MSKRARMSTASIRRIMLKKAATMANAKHTISGRAKENVKPISLPKLKCLEDKQ